MRLQRNSFTSGKSVAITVRRATTADAVGVWRVADMLSRSQQERADGANAQILSAKGFLLYPLAAEATDEPNYAERIRGSGHFWVALRGQEIVGFLMAYTFEEFRRFTNLNENDASTLAFFTSTMAARESAIYLAQIGVRVDCRAVGAAAALLRSAFDGIDGSRHPAVFAEIAQRPLWNKASSRAAIRYGFVPLFLREKDSHKPEGEQRLSATFVRTFPWSGPVKQPTFR